MGVDNGIGEEGMLPNYEYSGNSLLFIQSILSLSCQVPATWPRWSTCSQGSGTICCAGETQFRPSLSDGGKARKTAVHRKLTPDSAEDLRTWRTGAPSLTLVVRAAEGGMSRLQCSKFDLH